MHWFIRKGIFFMPITLSGRLIFGVACACAAWSFISIDQHSHSASDTLTNWVFQCLLIGAVYSAIGFFTSRESHP